MVASRVPGFRGSGVPGFTGETDDAYAVCLQLAREHYENFPVASRLLPRAMRPHVAAIYAFARMADDFADEGSDADERRLERLDDWRRWLHAAAARRPVQPADETAQAVFMALGATIRRCGLDVALLDDLLSAFRQDVLVKRYEDWDDLLDYCRRSANPVGRLVLAVAGIRDPATLEASDALCTALQLTNFWQDLERDWRKGRLYVPAAIVRAAGADTRALDRGELSEAWQNAMTTVADRTRTLFARGRPVADHVTGRLRWELRATWLGGLRVLDRLEQARFDVFVNRPTLGWRDAGPIAWGMITWFRGSGGPRFRGSEVRSAAEPRNSGTPEPRNPETPG